VYLELAAYRSCYFTAPGTGWEPLLRYGQTTIREKILYGPAPFCSVVRPPGFSPSYAPFRSRRTRWSAGSGATRRPGSAWTQCRNGAAPAEAAAGSRLASCLAGRADVRHFAPRLSRGRPSPASEGRLPGEIPASVRHPESAVRGLHTPFRGFSCDGGGVPARHQPGGRNRLPTVGTGVAGRERYRHPRRLSAKGTVGAVARGIRYKAAAAR
jgi:hypothetical protein